MEAIAKWFISFVFGDVVKGVQEWHKDTLAAENSRDVIDADLTKRAIDLQVRERELNLEMQRVDAGSWLGRNIRPLLALPFVVYAWKAVAIDKVIAPWIFHLDLSTDPITGDLATWGTAIITFYMGGRTLELVASRFARR